MGQNTFKPNLVHSSKEFKGTSTWVCWYTQKLGPYNFCGFPSQNQEIQKDVAPNGGSFTGSNETVIIVQLQLGIMSYRLIFINVALGPPMEDFFGTAIWALLRKMTREEKASLGMFQLPTYTYLQNRTLDPKCAAEKREAIY